MLRLCATQVETLRDSDRVRVWICGLGKFIPATHYGKNVFNQTRRCHYTCFRQICLSSLVKSPGFNLSGKRRSGKRSLNYFITTEVLTEV